MTPGGEKRSAPRYRWKDEADFAPRAREKASRSPFPREPFRFWGAQEEIYRALVLGTGDYVRKNGFQKVVLGLSGGIDSSLTAAIAVDALGKESVVGVAMPSQYSSTESLEDARALAENLGVEFQVIPIGEVFHAYLKTLKPSFRGRKAGCDGRKHSGPDPRETCSWPFPINSAGWY